MVPLGPYASDIQCPYPKLPGGTMDLPSWIYSPQTGKCYYKSSFAKGISNNINDATRRCTVRAPARLRACCSCVFVCVCVGGGGRRMQTGSAVARPQQTNTGHADVCAS